VNGNDANNVSRMAKIYSTLVGIKDVRYALINCVVVFYEEK